MCTSVFNYFFIIVGDSTASSKIGRKRATRPQKCRCVCLIVFFRRDLCYDITFLNSSVPWKSSVYIVTFAMT